MTSDGDRSGAPDRLPTSFDRRALLAACAGGVGAAGCLERLSGADPDGWAAEARLPDASLGRDDVPDGFRRGQDAFALALHRALVDAADESFVASPLGLSLATSMLATGGSAVREALADVLGVEPAAIHRGNAAVIRDLADRDWERGHQPHDVLGIATGVWTDADRTVRPDVRETLETYYGAALHETAFDAPSEARAEIHDWVAEQTSGSIEEAIPPGALGPDILLLVVSVLHFAGEWASQFDPDDTEPSEFEGLDGRTATVPTMNQTDDFRFHRGESVTVLELPYVGGDLVLDLFLPRPGTFREFEAELDATGLQSLLDGLEEREVHVRLPRFTLASEWDLRPVLAELGLSAVLEDDAFDEFFEAAAGPLGLLRQETRIDVDEEGTTASSVTLGNVAVSAPPTFDATRPFLYLLRDRVTGAICFSGRVVDPDGAADEV